MEPTPKGVFALLDDLAQYIKADSNRLYGKWEWPAGRLHEGMELTVPLPVMRREPAKQDEWDRRCEQHRNELERLERLTPAADAGDFLRETVIAYMEEYHDAVNALLDFERGTIDAFQRGEISDPTFGSTGGRFLSELERRVEAAAQKLRRVALAAESKAARGKPKASASGTKPKRRTARKNDPVVLNAVLMTWHKIGSDDEHLTPATQDDLLNKMELKGKSGWDDARLSRAMNVLFEDGMKTYKQACASEALKGILERDDDGGLTATGVYDRQAE